MRLTDTLFYWLQMKLMTEARPEDEAARESLHFFAQILSEDHELAEFAVVSKDSAKIYVDYRLRNETPKTVWFDREAAEQIVRDLYGAAEGVVDEDHEVNE